MVAQDYECDLFWFRHVTWVLLLLMTLLGEFFDPGCAGRTHARLHRAVSLASQLAASCRQFVPLLIRSFVGALRSIGKSVVVILLLVGCPSPIPMRLGHSRLEPRQGPY